MKDNKLLAYYTILFLYLIVAFFLETQLRIMVNVSFCLFSAFFYFSYRKSTLHNQDIYFIICLIFSAIACLLPAWRNIQIGLSMEMLTSTCMLIFLLLSMKSSTQYLFLGTNWALILGVSIILLAILYFTNHFLPYINDLDAPLSVVFVFVLGFIFLITLIRTVNDTSYLLLFLGVLLIIMSCIVAAISIYHNRFAINNFWEDALAVSGICFLTSGMLKVVAQKRLSKAFSQPRQNLSLLYFLKKIF